MRRCGRGLGVTVAVAAALAGCGPGNPPTTRAAPSAAASSASSASAEPPATASGTPVFGSTAESSLPPQPVTPYVPAAGTAPTQSFAVGRRDLSFSRGPHRPLPVRIWYPAAGDPGGAPADNATPATGRFPVVLFSHGLNSQPEEHAAMLLRWAQAGFVVAAPTYPHTRYGANPTVADDVVNQPADASHVLTGLLQLNTADEPVAAHLDADRIGAAGHSAGGITTAGLFSSERDDRLKAGIVLAGTDFRGSPFSGPAAAMLFVHGAKDNSVTYRAGNTVFQAVPWSRAMLAVTNGRHGMTGHDFEAITGTTIEFLRWSLYGDTAAKARIPAKAAVNGVATLQNQL